MKVYFLTLIELINEIEANDGSDEWKDVKRMA